MKSLRTEQLETTDFSPPAASVGRKLPLKLILIGALILSFVGYVLYFVIAASSLQVTSTPKANISVEGGWHVVIGDRYLLLPGSFRVSASTEGYQTQQVEVEIESGKSSAVEFRLSPLPGDLRITTVPEIPVQVILDGTDQGLLTNPLLTQLSAGTHQISLDAWLYKGWQSEVEIPGRGETLNLQVELEPNWVEYQIKSDPEGAQIRVDGMDFGQTPANFRLEAGSRKLSLSLPGYRDFLMSLELAEGSGPVGDDIRLVPMESSLSLQTEPQGATVTLNGNYMGETPLELELAPERPHQLSLFKAGYLLHSQQIQMQHLENRDLSVNLQPDMAEVSISVAPADAEVLVDGEVVGTGNQSLRLMTRKQKISVRRDGYETQVEEILPTRSLALHLNFRLLTEEESEWASIPQRYTNSANQQLLLFRDAGMVQLGSERVETERRANETRWQADLQRAFYVASTQVTNAQYRAYNADHSSGNHDGLSLDGPDQPVVNISWQEAALYCNWLSEQEGLEPFYTTTKGFVAGVNPQSVGYRLMTEAEWSWLARTTPAGLTQKYSWGDSETPSSVENIAGVEASGIINFFLETLQDKYPVSAPVGSFPPNHRGLFDINGNASEWIQDWYSPQPYPESSVQPDPLGPEIGEFHVIRGANWARGYLPQLRLAYRDFGATARDDVGFRVVRYAK